MQIGRMQIGGIVMVAHIVVETVLMVFGITIAGVLIGKLFRESEEE